MRSRPSWPASRSPETGSMAKVCRGWATEVANSTARGGTGDPLLPWRASARGRRHATGASGPREPLHARGVAEVKRSRSARRERARCRVACVLPVTPQPRVGPVPHGNPWGSGAGPGCGRWNGSACGGRPRRPQRAWRRRRCGRRPRCRWWWWFERQGVARSSSCGRVGTSAATAQSMSATTISVTSMSPPRNLLSPGMSTVPPRGRRRSPPWPPVAPVALVAPVAHRSSEAATGRRPRPAPRSRAGRRGRPGCSPRPRRSGRGCPARSAVCSSVQVPRHWGSPARPRRRGCRRARTGRSRTTRSAAARSSRPGLREPGPTGSAWPRPARAAPRSTRLATLRPATRRVGGRPPCARVGLLASAPAVGPLAPGPPAIQVPEPGLSAAGVPAVRLPGLGRDVTWRREAWPSCARVRWRGCRSGVGLGACDPSAPGLRRPAVGRQPSRHPGPWPWCALVGRTGCLPWAGLPVLGLPAAGRASARGPETCPPR